MSPPTGRLFELSGGTVGVPLEDTELEALEVTVRCPGQGTHDGVDRCGLHGGSHGSGIILARLGDTGCQSLHGRVGGPDEGA
ncbi:hypothetical protein D3C85_1614920 [compost metagenome]